MAEVLAPAAFPDLADDMDRDEAQARVMAIGPAACQALSAWSPRMKVARCCVDAASCLQAPHGMAQIALQAEADTSDAALQALADGAADQLLAWLRGDRGDLTVLLVDTASAVGRAVGMPVLRRLQDAGLRVLTMSLSAHMHQGVALVQQSLHAHAQLQAQSQASVLIDGARFGTLDSPLPYVHHALDTVLMAVDEYGHVNVDAEDVFAVLQGAHSHMAHAVLQRGPSLVPDMLEQLTQGRLLTMAELRRARSALVLMDAARGTHKLSDARAVMQALSSLVPPDAHFIYGSAYSQRAEGELGVTVLLSY